MKGSAGRLRKFMQDRNIKVAGIVLWIVAAAVLIGSCIFFYNLSAASNHTFPVVFSEVMASNTSYPNRDGRCCDYIEIHNRADYAIDLTGFRLGDVDGENRYTFPSGTILEADAYLVIYCDKTVRDDFYAPFEISRSGNEHFYLIAENSAIVDSMITVATDIDQSMILWEGQWVQTENVTPGLPNDAASAEQQDIWNPGVSPVRITELSSVNSWYDPESGKYCDWIELHNTSDVPIDISGFVITDNGGNDKYRISQGTILDAGAYLVVPCSDKAENAAPFGLSQTTEESVVLKNEQGLIIQILKTLPMNSGSMMLDMTGNWVLTEQLSPGYENSERGHIACMEKRGCLPGTIRITEVMAAEQVILPDEEDAFSDWVELHNTSDQEVDLSGWYFSDDPDVPQKWSFPELVMKPGERKILFCSGRNVVTGPWIHTGFSLSAGGETMTLYNSLGIAVDTVTFPEAQDHTSFVFDSGSAVITEYPTPGYTNDPQGYESFSADQIPQGPLAIWEVMTANDRYLPQQLGECFDWAELCNISGEPLDLSGYSISDDPDLPGQYVFPERILAPGESIVVLLSAETELVRPGVLCAAFSLDAQLDRLYLYDPRGVLIDYVLLRNIPSGCSYGRTPDFGGFAYMEPTPQKPNVQGFSRISEPVQANYASGVYSGDTDFLVELSAPGDVYYTLDGSVPTTSSALYTAPLKLTDTAVVRALAVENGKMPSDVYTATFIVGDVHDLPIVSLVTDPQGLWGINGVYRNGDASVKEVKLDAHVAYTGEDGSFSRDCLMNLHGATTVTAFDKKSFAVRFPDSCGGPLVYDVFEDGEITAFRSLIIRTSHESVYSSQLHDALMAHVASQCSDTVLSQKYKYVALYLNGEYWGLYAIRERHSQEHYASYMQVPAEDVQIVRFATDEQNSLYDLYNFCKTHSLADPENYAYVCSQLDVYSFADWIIFQAYVSNVDIYENIRYYYSPADGLWRMGLADLDLGIMGGTKAFGEVAETFHHGRLVKALMENPDFQDLLATRLAELLRGPMSDENMVATIEAMAKIIEQEAVWEEARWGTPVWGWKSSVDQMIRFCQGRSGEMIDSLCRQLHFTQEQREFYFGDLE